MSEWIDVNTRKPTQERIVLVAVENTNRRDNYRYVTMACYIKEKTLLVDFNFAPDDFGELDEETGETFCPEGWYEENDDGDLILMNHRVVSWMELPKPPLRTKKT